jgi:hypothetical protein
MLSVAPALANMAGAALAAAVSAGFAATLSALAFSPDEQAAASASATGMRVIAVSRVSA